MFELGGEGGSSRQNKCALTPKMHTVQNKVAALKKKKKQTEKGKAEES